MNVLHILLAISLLGDMLGASPPSLSAHDQEEVNRLCAELNDLASPHTGTDDVEAQKRDFEKSLRQIRTKIPVLIRLAKAQSETYLMPAEFLSPFLRDANPGAGSLIPRISYTLWVLYRANEDAFFGVADGAMERARTAGDIVTSLYGRDLASYGSLFSELEHGLYLGVRECRTQVMEIAEGNDRYLDDALDLALVADCDLAAMRYLKSLIPRRPELREQLIRYAQDDRNAIGRQHARWVAYEVERIPPVARPTTGVVAVANSPLTREIVEVRQRLSHAMVAQDAAWLSQRKDAVLAVARQEATRLMTLRGRKSGPGLPLPTCLDALHLADPSAARAYELHQLKRAQLGLWIAERPWQADPRKTREMLGEEQTDLLVGLADVRAILLKRMMAQKDDQAAAIAKSAVRYDEDGVCLDYLLSLDPQPEGLAAYLLDGLAATWPGLQRNRARLLQALDLDENLRARTEQ